MELKFLKEFKEKRQRKLCIKRACEFSAQNTPYTVDNQRIIYLYNKGYNLTELAKYLGCTRNRAYIICKGFNDKVCIELPDKIIHKAVKFYNKGYSLEKIAKKCKLKVSDINIILSIEGEKGFASFEIVLHKETINKIYILADDISSKRKADGKKGTLNTTDAKFILNQLIHDSYGDEYVITEDNIIKRLKQMNLYETDKKYSNKITDEEKERFYTMYTRDGHSIRDISKYTHHSERTVSKYIKEYEKEYIKKNFIDKDNSNND